MDGFRGEGLPGHQVTLMENHHQVVQNSWKLNDLMESMGELRELKELVREQGEKILSLMDCVMVLERSPRSSLSRGMGSSINGTA